MPYTESDHIETVPPEAKLWRYMSFAKFMNMLMLDQLHFHVASGFNDDFEGTVPEAVKEVMEEEYAEAAENGDFPENGLEEHKKLIGVLRDITYLSCWHNKGHESAAMWSKYGNEDGAVAIESSVRNLRRALTPTEHQVHIGKVEYTIFNEDYREESEDDLSDVDPDELNPKFLLTNEEANVFSSFLYKRKSFDYEDEIRAIIQNPSYAESKDEENALPIRIQTDDGRKYLKDETDSDQNGIDPHITVSELIDKIHVSPGSHDWILQTIREAVKAKRGLPTADEEVESFVVESQLDDNPVFSPDSE
jgi:hypothetical protein